MGQRGEERAVEYLTQQGFVVRETNLRLANKEVDIVAQDPGTNEIVFVEVKTRQHSLFGHPSEAVTQTKIFHLNRVAQEYLRKHQLDNDFRFDIICVTPQGIEHFDNVTMFGR